MNNSLEHGSQGNLSDAYISSLNTANPLPLKMGQNVAQQPAHNQGEQDMHLQEEAYKKTVIIVLWYQANLPPIRLQETIANFPYFQLSKVSSLMVELGLSQNTYLDTYNPDTCQWDQHSISSVRKIETHQRLLYRVRKSFLEGFIDEECLGIEEELKLQRRSNKSFRTPNPSPIPTKLRGDASSHRCVCKRTSADDSEPDTHISSKVHIPNDYYLNHQPIIHRNNGGGQGSLPNDATTTSGTSLPTPSTSPSDTHAQSNSTQSLPTPPSSSSSNVSHDPRDEYTYPNPSIYDTTSPTSATSNLSNTGGGPNLALPISSYPPHPPLKRWPNDYTVAEISAGFGTMDALVAQSANGSTMTHKAAFERVFGSRYVKSTVCRHRGVWKKAHPSLKAQYEAMGHDERAYWGEFVRHVEGRPSSLRVTGSNSNLGPTQNVSLGQRQGVTSEDEDGGHDDDVQVIKSLQSNQVSQTIQNIDTYDSPLSSLTNTHS